MSDKLQFRRLKKGIGEAGKTKAKGYFAVMGKLDGTVLTGVGNRVYVTSLSDGLPREVLNRRNVPNRAGLVVFVGSDEYSANRIEVLFELGSEGSSNNGVTSVNPAIPPHNHSWPGLNTTWVHGQQFLPLLAKPIAGTLTIQIYPGVVRNSTLDGWVFIGDQVVDVSGDMPASDALWITLQANDDGSVDYVVGSTNVTRASLDEGDIPEATTGKAIWAVILEAGYNELFQNSARNDFLDLRFDKGGVGAVDVFYITYTPAVLSDWDYLDDPGNYKDAIDQLAARVKDLELVGGGGGGTPSIELIASETLSGTSAFAVVTIPAGYDEIWIVGKRIRSSLAATADVAALRVGNGSIDTGNNYAYICHREGSSSSNDTSAAATYFGGVIVPGNTASAGYFGTFLAKIFDADGTTYNKTVDYRGSNPDAAAERESSGGGLWLSTSAIDRIQLIAVTSGSFIAGSQLDVLGVIYG